MPTNEAVSSGYYYLRELITGVPKLFFGKFGGSTSIFKRPNRLWNGNIFEGDEIDVI